MMNWQQAAEVLAPALVYSDEVWSMDYMARGVAAGHFQFWPGHRSAGVTQVLDADGERRVHILIAGGALPELLAMETAVSAWARDIGAARVTCGGRRGWVRVLARRGYTDVNGTFQKEVAP